MRKIYDNNILPKQIAFITFKTARVYNMTYLSNTYLCAIWHISNYRNGNTSLLHQQSLICIQDIISYNTSQCHQLSKAWTTSKAGGFSRLVKLFFNSCGGGSGPGIRMVTASFFENCKKVVLQQKRFFLANKVIYYYWSVLFKGGSCVCTDQKIRQIPIPANRWKPQNTRQIRSMSHRHHWPYRSTPGERSRRDADPLPGQILKKDTTCFIW